MLTESVKVTYIQFYMGEILIQGSARNVQSQRNDYKVGFPLDLIKIKFDIYIIFGDLKISKRNPVLRSP